VNKKILSLKLIKEFKETGKALYISGLNSYLSGNISVFIPSHKKIIITKHKTPLSEISKRKLTVLSIYSKTQKEASWDFFLHQKIYKTTNKKAIIHAHLPFATALSFLNSVIKLIDLEGNFYLKEIPVLNENVQDISSEKVKKYFSKFKVIIFKGHGVYAVGENLKDALFYITSCELSAKINYFVNSFKRKF
jgi:L-fuculose-phosphate aldolase